MKLIQIRRLSVLAFLTMFVAACTSIHISKIDPQAYPMRLVCIEENPEVTVDGFVIAVQNGFQRHGIPSKVFVGSTAPQGCEYVLQYTARRGWDMVSFLKYAEIRVSHQGMLVGSATYRHAGGFGFNKYASTETKVYRLTDKLLVGFTPSR